MDGDLELRLRLAQKCPISHMEFLYVSPFTQACLILRESSLETDFETSRAAK